MATELVDDRELALTCFQYETWAHENGIDWFKDLLKDWQLLAIVRDGECIGCCYKNSGEVHVTIAPEWRKKWATRAILRQVFEGSTMTRITKGHDYMFDVFNRCKAIELVPQKFEVK